MPPFSSSSFRIRKEGRIVKVRLVAFFVFSLLISSVHAQDTVHVKAGWNNIGSIQAGAVPDVMNTIPAGIIISSFFGYVPEVGYQPTDTLGMGMGYWVKVLVDGIVRFKPADTCKSKAFVYQGILYHTVKIGNQCWMAENLNVGTMVTGVTEQTDNGTIEKYCYRDSILSCTLYGGLYQWNEAMQYSVTPGTQGICPSGWHIPTHYEFLTLNSAVYNNGNALKAMLSGVVATNISGFSALIAGQRDGTGTFGSLGTFTDIWSSTENAATLAFDLQLASYNGGIAHAEYFKDYGVSVRCIQD
jgi:uncharacterized protein (TIGR02145 family)